MTIIAQNHERKSMRMPVRIEHLDRLLGLAGEVIITSANLQDMERRIHSAASQKRLLQDDDVSLFKASNEVTRRVSQDLHDLVMDIRLVEIGETLRVLKRPVRDLAKKLDRSATLTFVGEETMVDKALAERLIDPMLHLLRNAVDHGLESPLERSNSHKPSEGNVTITTTDFEHHLELSVSDDGRGIDEARIRESARKRGIDCTDVTPGLVDILCSPGFSTKDSVSSTSGRGVGLDLVKTMIDEFSGSIELETSPGKGSEFKLVIPKLKAVNIIDALTLQAGSSLYAFPIQQVVASLGVDPSSIISSMGHTNYISHLNETIVIYNLPEFLGEEPIPVGDTPLSVVIIQNQNQKVAFIISEFLGPQKLVNIPFEDGMERASGIVGTCVFTGGRLGLTINPDELVSSNGANATTYEAEAQTRDENVAGEKTENSSNDRFSISTSSLQAGVGNSLSGEISEEHMSELLDELKSGLATLQDSLIELETTTEDTKLLNQAFRRLHAAKGNFTMLNAEAASDTAHQLETVLDYVRNQRIELTSNCMDLLLDGVGYLIDSAKNLPLNYLEAPNNLLDNLQQIVDNNSKTSRVFSENDLLSIPFSLSPTEELQVVSANKQGARIYETFLSFSSGRQPDFLVAYLILRRLGMSGNIYSTLPDIADIESGNCGTGLKILWSTMVDDEELEDLESVLKNYYDVMDFNSITTSIFRYDPGSSL